MKAAVVIAVFAALIAGGASGRERLTEATKHFYASPDGNDANDCREATPCRQPQRVIDEIKNNYDLNCVQPRIWLRPVRDAQGNFVSPGVYEGFEDYGQAVGCQRHGGGPIIIGGDCGAPYGAGNVIVNSTAVGRNAISLDGGAQIVVVCKTINASGAAALYATMATIEFGSVIFGTANIQAHADAGGVIVATGSYTVAQGAVNHIRATTGGVFDAVPGVQVTFSTPMAFTHLIFAQTGGIAKVGGLTWLNPGNVSGQKCYASILAIVHANGNAAALPGTSPCGANYQGQVY